MMMAGPFKIGVEDETGADLGFALSCLALGIITMEEMHQWIHHVIENIPGGDVPPHLLALLAVQNQNNIFRPNDAVMHRLPHDPFITDERFQALVGLQRKLRPEHEAVASMTAKQAQAALSRNPEVEDRFRAVFPFLTQKLG